MDNIAKDKTIPLVPVTAKDFRVFSYQAVFFTPDEEVSSVKIVKWLPSQWREAFDGEQFVAPLAQGIPPELPKVILQSKSGGWRCQIASARFDLFWTRQLSDPGPLAMTEFFSQAVSYLCEYQNFQNARIGRLAAVLKRYAPHPAPGLFLAKHFCKDQWTETAPLNRPEEFELHAHKRYRLNGQLSVNSWARSKSAQANFGEQSQSVILVEQDINTTPEEIASRAFKKEEIENFFSLAAKEFDVILQQYYP